MIDNCEDIGFNTNNWLGSWFNFKDNYGGSGLNYIPPFLGEFSLKGMLQYCLTVTFELSLDLPQGFYTSIQPGKEFLFQPL
jgi:hypothetical protein